MILIESKGKRTSEFIDGALIDYDFREYYLVCDNCGKRISFEDFWDAVNYKKENGWKSRKQGEDWIDICNECNE